jgi:hypothetical protein
MHQTAIAHRSQQEWQGKVEAQSAGMQIAISKGHCVPRPESDVLKHAAIFPQRDFALGTPVQVVEHRFRHSVTCERPEILDADDTRGCDGAGCFAHLHFRSEVEEFV